MSDKEKIIKGLEECVGNGNCTKCQYGSEKQALSCKKLLTDALAILKEQDAVVRCRNCKHFDRSKLYKCQIHGSLFQPKDADWFCADGEWK